MNKQTRPCKLGALLLKYRLDNNINQQQLAKLLSTSPQHLSDIEYNRRQPGDNLIDNISIICKVHTNIIYLMTGRLSPTLVDALQSLDEVEIFKVSKLIMQMRSKKVDRVLNHGKVYNKK